MINNVQVVARLDPSTRSRAIADAAGGGLDLVVVGGGVVGCGIAVDAAARGLTVALFERDDLGAGASGRTSKLVHGGLRYLERLDLRLVREALHERSVLLRNAGDLVAPIRFLLPVARRGVASGSVGAGLTLYDALAGRRSPLPRHRRLDSRELHEAAPGLDARLVGGFEFWDATVDDARLTVTLARTAATLGARIASRVEVTGLLRAGGRVVGVRAVDRLSGDEVEARAPLVVCAVGAETTLLQRRLAATPVVPTAPSKGAHVVVPRELVDSSAALITRTSDSVLFAIPWNDHWLLGTTDTPWRNPAVQPTATEEDARYLLDQANRILARPLELGDVVAGYAGTRPLVAASGAAATARLSRRHAVVRSSDGLVVVAGGKLTTYRLLARDAVDAALGPRAARSLPSPTEALPLVGQEQTPATEQPATALLPPASADRLRRRYGTLVAEVLDPARDDPALLDPLPGAPGYLVAEVLYAATHEGALDLEDVLARRTHVAIETRDHGVRAAEVAARLVSPALGWDEARIQRSVASYRSLVAATSPAADAVAVAS